MDVFLISDEDECQLEKHNCHENANCINRLGSFDCSCNNGFSGDGHDCTGIKDTNFRSIVNITVKSCYNVNCMSV